MSCQLGLSGHSLKRQAKLEKFLYSKHVLKVYFKPSWKNPDFGSLPLPIFPVSVKNGHLRNIMISMPPHFYENDGIFIMEITFHFFFVLVHNFCKLPKSLASLRTKCEAYFGIIYTSLSGN